VAEISRHVLVSDFRSIDPREARILLIEAGPRILPAFPPELAERAEQSLRHLGVEVRVHSPVTGVGENHVDVAGQRLEAGTILWCAGVSASPLARSLGASLDRAGRVLVGVDLTVPGHSEIFVIGDLAAFLHQTGQPLPGVAQVAIQQGRQAARNIARASSGQAALPFHYRDRGNLAVLGRASAIAEIGRWKLSGLLAWLCWCFIHILYLIGFRNRLVVMLEWAWSYLTWQRGARLITGPIGTRSKV
jgi:NADH dehydrogenase